MGRSPGGAGGRRPAAMGAVGALGVGLLALHPGVGLGAQPAAEGPSPRGAAVVVAAEDPARLLVYGGIGAEPEPFADLWSWDGLEWTRVWRASADDRGPGARFNAAGAWHRDTGMLVVHGGGAVDEARGDTWGWDGRRWHLLAPGGAGPSARTCARMVERTRTGELVLFGGADPGGRVLSDTWSWDGRRWTLLDDGGATRGCFHGLAYDPVRDRVVRFGGRTGEGREGSTWEWDGASWSRVDVDGPAARDHHGLAWDGRTRTVVAFGGGGQDPGGDWDGSILADTWRWDGRTWAPAPAGPARYHAPGMAWARGFEGLLLFGGADGDQSYADLHLLTAGGWRGWPPERERPDPGPRSSHVTAWDPESRSVVLAGGLDRPDGLWSWNGRSWRLLQHGAGPLGRTHMALAPVPGGGLLVQGGFEGRQGRPGGARYGDAWLRSADGTWRRVSRDDEGPGVRDHHAMAAAPELGAVVLFGGSRGAGEDAALLGDTWLWQDGRWTRGPASGPPPRATHRLAWDPVRRRLVLFGGWGEEGLLNDVWEFDGSAWTDLTPPADQRAPTPRFAARLAFDATRGVTVLVGGRGADGDLGDAWSWDGRAWRELGGPTPPPRNVHGLAFDPDRGVLVLTGGIHQGEVYPSTWEWDGAAWRRIAP